MKGKYKLLAMLLAATMIMSSLPVSAIAEGVNGAISSVQSTSEETDTDVAALESEDAQSDTSQMQEEETENSSEESQTEESQTEESQAEEQNDTDGNAVDDSEQEEQTESSSVESQPEEQNNAEENSDASEDDATDDATQDIGPYVGAPTVVEIRTFDDLKQVSYRTDLNNTNLTCNLMNDIDCKQGTLRPIGTPTKPFAGTFNGNGHYISNYTLFPLNQGSGSYSYYGFFGKVKSAKILDLNLMQSSKDDYVGLERLENVTIGGVCAIADGNTLIQNCNYFNSYGNGGTRNLKFRENDGDFFWGGIVGQILPGNTVTITNSSNLTPTLNLKIPLTAHHGAIYIGGIVGRNFGTFIIANCNNATSFHLNFTSSSGSVLALPDECMIGGIVGYSNDANNGPCTIANCTNGGATICLQYDQVKTTAMDLVSLGGIIGYSSCGNLSVQKCENKAGILEIREGATVDNDQYAGGIVGHMYQGTIENCTFEVGKGLEERYYGVLGVKNVGGIAGELDHGKINVCHVKNTVKNNSSFTNRICGYENVGGIAGVLGETASISNCELQGPTEVFGDRNLGALVGRNEGIIENTPMVHWSVHVQYLQDPLKSDCGEIESDEVKDGTQTIDRATIGAIAGYCGAGAQIINCYVLEDSQGTLKLDPVGSASPKIIPKNEVFKSAEFMSGPDAIMNMHLDSTVWETPPMNTKNADGTTTYYFPQLRDVGVTDGEVTDGEEVGDVIWKNSMNSRDFVQAFDPSYGDIVIRGSGLENGVEVEQNGNIYKTADKYGTILLTGTEEDIGDKTIKVVKGTDGKMEQKITIDDLYLTSNRPISIEEGVDVHINVKDNNVINANGEYPAIEVPAGAALTIEGTGKLQAHANGVGAGIGTRGYEARSEAHGGHKESGTVTIAGDVQVDSSSLKGAGIGGGAVIIDNFEQQGFSNGTVIIDGNAKVIAKGGGESAGIGGGQCTTKLCRARGGNGGTVVIQGNADVKAYATGAYATGIGGGGADTLSLAPIAGDGGSVTVKDSANVYAKGAVHGAGIGGGGAYHHDVCNGGLSMSAASITHPGDGGSLQMTGESRVEAVSGGEDSQAVGAGGHSGGVKNVPGQPTIMSIYPTSTLIRR